MIYKLLFVFKLIRKNTTHIFPILCKVNEYKYFLGEENIDGLILESPFNNLRDAALYHPLSLVSSNLINIYSNDIFIDNIVFKGNGTINYVLM